MGELVPYKRFELAIHAARRAGLKLIVVGDGPARRRLEALATGGGVEFVGRVPDATVVDLISDAEVLIHPGVEDFGIVMAEALAAGVPVIANRHGGAAEIVTESTGLLADENVDSLSDALRIVRETQWDRGALRERALSFGIKRFRRELSAIVAETYATLSN